MGASGGRMRKRCSASFLFVLLVFGLTLAVASEDAPETTYDESETQPYEGIPSLPFSVPTVVSRTSHEVLVCSRPQSGTPYLCGTARVRHTDPHRSAKAQNSLALLSTLRC